MHRHAERHPFHLRRLIPRIVEPVGLRQHDLRHRTALPDRHEIPLDPPRLEIGAERGDDERDVDVRRERLRFGRAAGSLADDRTSPGQDLADQPIAEADPVADRDVELFVHEPSGQARPDGAVARLDVERSAVRRGDASRHEAGRQVFGKLGTPSERSQVELEQRNLLTGRGKRGRRGGRLPQELRPSRG